MTYVPALSYGWLTPFYDRLVELYGVGPQRRAMIARLLGVRPQERLLDLGCGTGTFLAAACRLEPAADGTGVDVDSVSALGRCDRS